VVANAAVSLYEPFEDQAEETIDLMLDANLKGTLLCAQLAMAELRRRGGGSIDAASYATGTTIVVDGGYLTVKKL